MTTIRRPMLALTTLAALAGCQPPATPVVEAHIETPRAPASAAAEPDAPGGGLTVRGTATLDVAPNQAAVKLDLVSHASSPRAAVERLRAREAQMRANLADEGVDADAMAVSTVQLNPTHRWDAQRERNIPTGYDATLCVTATTEDFTTIPAIIEAGAKAGVTQSSTRFSNTEMTALKSRVRGMALEAAKAKAAQFSEALDLPGLRVTSVAESQAGQAWARYGGPFDNNIVANAAEFVPSTPGPLQAETLPLTLTVTVGYAF
ncbi:MAG: SIMPL domain-containing protein [Myxococcota bacterium]